MLKKKYDYNIKIVMIGDSGVGKTCILDRFIHNVFNPDRNPSKGVEYHSTTLQKDGQHINVQIWDTLGQEFFRSLTSSYFKGSVGAILVFDLTCIDSFKHLTSWINEFKEKAQPNSVIMLAGNKSDLYNSKENEEENHSQELRLCKDEIIKFAQENSLTYIETSAKTGENIQMAFENLFESILTNLFEGVYDVALPSDFENLQVQEDNQDSECC